MITLIANVGQLVTPEGHGAAFGARMSELRIDEGADILLRDGCIESIGSLKQPLEVDKTIDAKGKVVLPGLIDPHRHFGLPILSAVHAATHLSLLSEEGTRGGLARDEKLLLRGFRRATDSGTTSLEVKCGASRTDARDAEPLDLVMRAARTMPVLALPTLLEECPHSQRRARDDRISAVITEIIPAVCRRRLARFCDVVCGEDGYTKREAEAILRAARGAGLRPKVHVLGRQPDEAAMLGSELGAASVDHASSCGRRATAALRKSGTVCVVLPGTSFLCDQAYPKARDMIDAGLAIALGTDYGFAGYGVESMWACIAMASARMGMSLEEGIVAATLNAAAALDLADEAGSVEVGKRGDLVILDVEDYRDIEGSIGHDPVSMTLVGGRSVNGT